MLPKKIFNLSLSLQVFGSMLLGIVAGLILEERAAPLGDFGKIFISLIKTVAAPLLFFAILESILTTSFSGKKAVKMVAVALTNASIALLIAFTLCDLLKPGTYLSSLVNSVSQNSKLPFEALKGETSFLSALQSFFPQNLIDPFLKSDVPQLIFLALFFGFALRAVIRKKDPTLSAHTLALKIKFVYDVLEQALGFLVRFSPVAVFAVVAKAVGIQGLSVLKGLSVYLAIPTLGFLIQILFVYQFWIRVVAKRSLKKFWSKAKNVCVYAFGVNSSLASLPLTLHALDELEVSPEAARMGACVGTNLNNDGILLYEMVSVLMIAQAMGVTLTLTQQFAVAGTCMLATIGIAGIPEAGIISLSLILPQFGLSSELLTVFLSVDWVLARLRSVTNAVSDLTVSIAIDDREPRSLA